MSNKSFSNLVDTIYNFEDTRELNSFLKALLTKQEIEELSKRLEIIKFLKRGMPQRKIAEKLKIGIATVTRGSREIKKGNFKNVF